MINIKNNKLLSVGQLSSSECCRFHLAYPLKATNVPIFINPNGCCSSGPAFAGQNAAVTSQVAAAKAAAANLQQEAKNQPQLVALAKAKPNLVFLQKKGSQIPNPYIISYNFPAAAATAANKLVTNYVYKILFIYFKSMYCLISKPVFITTPDKIKIQLFYFLCLPKFLINKTAAAFAVPVAAAAESSQAFKGKGPGKPSQALGFNSKDLDVKVNLKRLTESNLTKVYPHKFKVICTILSKFFNTNVELELIRLHQPYYDSNILVNFLALIINKKNIGACIQRLYNSNIIKANKASAQEAIGDAATQKVAAAASLQLSGLNIKISGRLMREPIIPRITTKKFEKGFTAKGKINYFDQARFTHKNRKGAFTITVKSGQN